MMIDLTGQKIGKLTVLRALEERQNKYVVWECQCECGKIVSVTSRDLRHRRKDFCGCTTPYRKRVADLAGQRFGRLVAIRPTEERQNGGVVWECRCDCGNTVYVRNGRLRPGGAESCGCIPRKKTVRDLTGQRFGRLVALRPTDWREHKHVVWECQCDCGGIVYARGSHLAAGTILTCGCSRGNPLSEKEKAAFVKK